MTNLLKIWIVDELLKSARRSRIKRDYLMPAIDQLRWNKYRDDEIVDAMREMIDILVKPSPEPDAASPESDQPRQPTR